MESWHWKKIHTKFLKAVNKQIHISALQNNEYSYNDRLWSHDCDVYALLSSSRLLGKIPISSQRSNISILWYHKQFSGITKRRMCTEWFACSLRLLKQLDDRFRLIYTIIFVINSLISGYNSVEGRWDHWIVVCVVFTAQCRTLHHKVKYFPWFVWVISSYPQE